MDKIKSRPFLRMYLSTNYGADIVKIAVQCFPLPFAVSEHFSPLCLPCCCSCSLSSYACSWELVPFCSAEGQIVFSYLQWHYWISILSYFVLTTLVLLFSRWRNVLRSELKTTFVNVKVVIIQRTRSLLWNASAGFLSFYIHTYIWPHISWHRWQVNNTTSHE